MGLTLNMAFIKPLFVVEAYINSSCRIVKVKDDNGLDTLDAYVSVHNRSFISARKPSYAQKNYLCGFSDS